MGTESRSHMRDALLDWCGHIHVPAIISSLFLQLGDKYPVQNEMGLTLHGLDAFFEDLAFLLQLLYLLLILGELALIDFQKKIIISMLQVLIDFFQRNIHLAQGDEYLELEIFGEQVVSIAVASCCGGGEEVLFVIEDQKLLGEAGQPG